MTQSKVHVVGAGLAGLAAATALAERGAPLEVSEAAAQAGGRCRSYFDPQVGLVIDNGNHLVLSGNHAVRSYLTRLGAMDRLAGPKQARFSFVDAPSGKRWVVRPNPGPLPWWVFSRRRGVPGARARDYLRLLGLIRAQPGRRVDEVIACQGPVWDRLMHPFLLAALNTAPEGGAAELAARVVRETLAKGGAAYCPRIAQPTLSAAFVEPALTFLAARGEAVRLGRRLRKLQIDDERIVGLEFTDGVTRVASGEAVVLAVPPWAAAQLIPGLVVPESFEGIVNGHFRLPAPAGSEFITGVLGATVEWIFCFEDRISVTVSGANHLIGETREALAEKLWADVVRVLRVRADLPPWQIVKEKRATFAATPEEQRRRPGPITRFSNLLLAGDWTDTGLPATIEGALRSGFRAAGIVEQRGPA